MLKRRCTGIDLLHDLRRCKQAWSEHHHSISGERTANDNRAKVQTVAEQEALLEANKSANQQALQPFVLESKSLDQTAAASKENHHE
jgi:hypothetical protein